MRLRATTLSRKWVAGPGCLQVLVVICSSRLLDILTVINEC